MELNQLKRHASRIETLVEGLTRRQIDAILTRLCQEQQWELMGTALITAQEVPARAIIDCLMQYGQHAWLVPCACFRRQLRQAILAPGGRVGAGTFRDLDAEEGEEGIPEHILAEAEDIAAAAAARRETASVQAANVDRDPLRTLIVTKLAQKMTSERGAAEALIAIAQASAFEETRREAAMKIANNKRLVAALVKAARIADLVGVAENTHLTSARQNLARAMAADFERWRTEGNRPALEFIAEHHAEEGMREAAKAVLG
jgi:hypothetical protein